MLRIYNDQKAWSEAYELASELLQTSVIRQDIAELWSQAYVGKHGSGAGMSKTYASLKDEWDKEIIQSVKKERISRPAPTFAVQKLDGRKNHVSRLKRQSCSRNILGGMVQPVH